MNLFHKFLIPYSIILIQPYPIHSSHMEILELNKNPGIVVFKTNSVFIKEGFHTLIHEFNLDSFKIILKQYESIIAQLEENLNIIELVTILKQKQIQTHSILENLTTKSKRTKRSLNFLGSTIKMITGNLDNEDLLQIENQLETLKNSNNVLITENNEQVKINELFESRMNNLTKMAYRQTREIESIIKQNILGLDRAVDWKHVLHVHNIIFNIDMVQHQLTTIFESIQLSRLGVISKALLQPSELDFATQLLESQGITIESYDQTYEFLEPVAFHNGSKIIFLIKIPKLRQGEYVQLHIETIPIRGKIIPINATKAIIGNDETFLIIHPCINVEKSNICDIENLFNVSNDNCLHQILRGNIGNCTFTKSSNKTEVKSIKDLGVLVKNSIEPSLLQNNCGYGPRNLTGTFLVSFKDCSITLNGNKFKSRTFKGDIKLTILPLHSVKVEEIEEDTNSISNLEQLHIHNRHKLEYLLHSNQRNKSLSFGVIIMVACIVAVFSAFILKEVHRLKLKLTIQAPIVNMAETSQAELNRDGSN